MTPYDKTIRSLQRLGRSWAKKSTGMNFDDSNEFAMFWLNKGHGERRINDIIARCDEMLYHDATHIVVDAGWEELSR